LVSLDHDGLWLVSGLAEFWSLTMDERKRIAEVAIEEARAVKANPILQVCTGAANAKDTVELTLHAQVLGADMCYLQNPYMEAHGGPGILEFFRYVAERTDIALGMFNTPSSGAVMTPQECARIFEEVPAVCAIKDTPPNPPFHASLVARLAPDLVVWGNPYLTYNAGFLQQGLSGPCHLGAPAYLLETPGDRRFSTWFDLVLEGKLAEATEYYYAAGVEVPEPGYTAELPERPGYYTHWGSAYKYAASLLGLPVGDYPHSRPPQIKLAEADKDRIRNNYVRSGLIPS
jgi:4-hydroxy-tetrahydrodipicolinate synthase